MVADAGLLDPEDLLRRTRAHAGELRLGEASASSTSSVGSTVSNAAVMLVSAPSGTTIMSAPMRVKPTAMLRSMLCINVAPVKTTALPIATAAISSRLRALRRPRFCRARLSRAASARRPRCPARHEYLARSSGLQQSVHERVCFMCSSLVGMITQSWCPPLLGRMPISVSVEVSMTEMPLDWRWKPLNGVSTYLPS